MPRFVIGSVDMDLYPRRHDSLIERLFRERQEAEAERDRMMALLAGWRKSDLPGYDEFLAWVQREVPESMERRMVRAYGNK